METTGETGKIQVTQEVYERLKDEFIFEPRGLVNVKGKGQMLTWFLIEPMKPQRGTLRQVGKTVATA
jgi:adenylate cyclase